MRSAVAGSVLRFMGLIALLCLYGIPVTDHDPGSPLLRGLVLFALLAAWLWAPRMRRREAVPALVAVAAVGLVALPLAARVDRADALVDYSDWNWFGGKEITFNWDHTYGPLDWPRDGTTLLQVRVAAAVVLEGPGAGHLRRPALGAVALERPHQPAW